MTQRRQGVLYLFALLFDDVERFLGGAGVNFLFSVWVDRLEVVVSLFDCAAGDRPAIFAVGAVGQQFEEVLEVGGCERVALVHLNVGEVVVSGVFGLAALVEEEQICLDACACLRENSGRQADDAVQVTFVQQFALGLDEGVLVGPEEQPFIHDDSSPAVGVEAVNHFLEKQDLRRTGLVSVAGLGVTAFASAERRVHEDYVKQVGRAHEQAAVGLVAGERVAVPDVGLFYLVKN